MSEPEFAANYPNPPDGFTEVPEGSWKLANVNAGDQPLSTLHVSSCVIIAVANVEAGRGYLGHFFHPAHESRRRFHGMLQALEANEGGGSDLHGWVGGASYVRFATESDAREHNQKVGDDREYVQKKLSAIEHIVSLREEWMRDEETIPVLTFHPARPAIEFVRESLALSP
ncbi:MAG TPA: hypothetical protein VD706_03630 [Candidatus Saccharimonadales bacterium]|nr:hypothetical protein [Candidatus Saccharimonadales bacterium]